MCAHAVRCNVHVLRIVFSVGNNQIEHRLRVFDISSREFLLSKFKRKIVITIQYNTNVLEVYKLLSLLAKSYVM